MNTIFLRDRAFRRVLCGILCIISIAFFALEAEAQRRGGSFGGSRRSSPAYAPSRPAAPSSSFGGSRSMTTSPVPSTIQRHGTSFGGTRAMAPAASNYRRSYGIPRQSTPVTVPGATTPYMVHSYGGFTDGLMMGYLMGQTSAMWHTPFHPAFYYSRPVYVSNPDGTTEVYPPTFSFFKFFLGVAILGLIIWLLIRFFRRRFAGADSSQSSFA